MAFNVDLSATPAIINAGDSFVLAWDIKGGVGPLTVTVDNGVGDGGGGSGSRTIALSTATTYTVTVTDLLGNVRTSSINVVVIASMGTVTPDIFSAGVTNFASGANLPAATYRVDYVTGAMGYDSTSQFWTVNSPLNPNNGYSITDSASNVVKTSQGGAFLSTEAAVWAREAGTSNTYVHVGGKPIGIAFFDNPLDTNKSGTPNPTWRLFGPFSPITGSLTADDVTIYAGSSTTLRWSSTNATGAAVNGSGVSTTGTLAVSPATSTVYTLSLTAPNCTTTTRTVTVTVVPLPAPAGLIAASTCSGVTLSWTFSAPVTSFAILRDGVQVGTSSGTSYTDTPPAAWVDHSYTVEAINGAVTSSPSAAAIGQMYAAVAQATGLTLSAGPGTIIASWAAVAHASAYNLYRNGILAASTPGLAIVDAVTSDQAYTYTVAGVGPCGVGPQSAAATATALPAAKASTNTTAAASTASNVPAPPSTSTNSGTPAGTWTNAAKLPNNWN